jgi:hypothetical protein
MNQYWRRFRKIFRIARASTSARVDFQDQTFRMRLRAFALMRLKLGPAGAAALRER